MSNPVSLNFRSLAKAVGCDNKQLAETFKVEVSDIHRWQSGEPAPQAVIDQLIVWVGGILSRYEDILAIMNESSETDTHKVKIAVTRKQALINQFPYPGCEEVVAGLVQARCHYPLSIIPADDIEGDTKELRRDLHYQKEDEHGSFKGVVMGYMKYKNRPSILVTLNGYDTPIPCFIPKNYIQGIGETNTVNTAWTDERIKFDGTLHYNLFGRPESLEMDNIFNDRT